MTRTHTKLMNRNTAQLVLLQDFPLPPCCPRFPENQLFQRLFLVSFWKKRNKLHSQRVPCDCSLFSVHHCCFLSFFCFTFKATRKDLNRWRWGWGYRFGPETHLWLSPKLSLDSKQRPHTPEKTIYHRLQVDCWGNFPCLHYLFKEMTQKYQCLPL